MYPIKQSTAETILFFAHDVNGDGVTGLVDAGFTKRISKGSGAFAAMTVTITEAENGWYSYPLSTVHSDTVGLLTVSLSHASIKRVNQQWRVSVRTLDELASPTNITAATGIAIAVGGIASTSFAAGAIDAAALAADAITSSELAASAAQEIADEVLNRDIAGGGSGNTRNVRNALRALRNKVSEAAGTLTVTQEDDIAVAWTAAVIRTAATNPITSVDPV